MNNLDAFSFKDLILFLSKSLSKNIPIDLGKGCSAISETQTLTQFWHNKLLIAEGGKCFIKHSRCMASLGSSDAGDCPCWSALAWPVAHCCALRLTLSNSSKASTSQGPSWGDEKDGKGSRQALSACPVAAGSRLAWRLLAAAKTLCPKDVI